MKVKVKKLHPSSTNPSYAKEGDAGLDLTAVEHPTVDQYGVVTYKTGLALEIPEGHVGLLFPRSSVSKMGCRLANSVGVVDSSYRGEIMVKMDPSPASVAEMVGSNSVDNVPPVYKKGDRIAQLVIMPYPQIELEEVEELDSTERGEGGFGSSDK